MFDFTRCVHQRALFYHKSVLGFALFGVCSQNGILSEQTNQLGIFFTSRSVYEGSESKRVTAT